MTLPRHKFYEAIGFIGGRQMLCPARLFGIRRRGSRVRTYISTAVFRGPTHDGAAAPDGQAGARAACL
jgi:hypothetical protein